MKYDVRIGGKTRVVELARNSEKWRIFPRRKSSRRRRCRSRAEYFLDSVRRRIIRSARGSLPDGSLTFTPACRNSRRKWKIRAPGAAVATAQSKRKAASRFAAPMPGKVVRVLVNAGDPVEVGQGLLVVEAMKMQNEIRSPKSGRVEKLFVSEGQTVNAGDLLAWVD